MNPMLFLAEPAALAFGSERLPTFDVRVMLAVALACLTLASQQHDAPAAFSGTMMGLVLPITVITLVVVMLKKPAQPS